MKLPAPGTIEVAPSILSADFARLADEIAIIASAGLSVVHLDVMDGHFVPNITIGPPVISKLRTCSDLVFDTHLMISDPEQYVESFAKAGSDHITIHMEATQTPLALIDKIHSLGCTAGVCINPETPAEVIKPVIGHIEMVLVMTVRPGFGGQKFMADAAAKVVEVRGLVGPNCRIEVDGGIDSTTTPAVVKNGADTLVAGNAIFGQPDRYAAITAIQESARL